MEPNKDTEAAGSFPSFPSQRPLRVAPLHNDTIPDRFRSLQDTAFLPLLWRVRAGVWRGQYSWKCQLSMVSLYITLAFITTEPTIQAPGRLSPVKTAVAQTICEEELALLSWDTIHLLISTALGSRWLPCMFTSLWIEVALYSCARPLHLHGTGMRTRQTHHSECSGTWTRPETQESIHHTSAYRAILFALTSMPNAWY